MRHDKRGAGDCVAVLLRRVSSRAEFSTPFSRARSSRARSSRAVPRAPFLARRSSRAVPRAPFLARRSSRAVPRAPVPRAPFLARRSSRAVPRAPFIACPRAGEHDLNFSAGYSLVAGSSVVRPALYIENVFDKKYLLKGAFFSGASVGRPRNIQLRVNVGL
jgi:hypothetical protein